MDNRMNPEEAANAMRQDADQMMRMIRQIRAKKSSDFEAKDLLHWLCISLQQHTDFKISMANIIQNLGNRYPDFQLASVPTESIYQNSESLDVRNIEAPPFDESFWMGLDDL